MPRPAWWGHVTDAELREFGGVDGFLGANTARYLQWERRGAPHDGNETGACPVCKGWYPDRWGGPCDECEKGP